MKFAFHHQAIRVFTAAKFWPVSGANRVVAGISLATIAVVVFFAWKVILPGYTRPINRTYASRFGYAALKRGLNQPFAVATVRAQMRAFEDVEMGEGLMVCNPRVAPVLAIGSVAKVYVREGDRVKKGQLLAELDTTKAQAAFDLTRLTLESSEAELKRVTMGSPKDLESERPEKDTVNLQAYRKQIEIWREQNEANRVLLERGIISRTTFLESQARLVGAERDVVNGELSLAMSSKGQTQSIAIAENQVAAAKCALEMRANELKECKVYAPDDGIVQKVLIQPEEYNGAPGTPAFIIASGLWFEARLDQKAIQKVRIGDTADVELEAAGKALTGKIVQIVPIVSYDTGGPETSRPVRPMGTGAPEWPTTFPARIEVCPEPDVILVPGLTGFARVRMQRTSIAVPQAAITSISAGNGVVRVFNSGRPLVRPVRLGSTWHGWTEIKEGVAADESVLVEGHEDLREGDRVYEIPSAIAGHP